MLEKDGQQILSVPFGKNGGSDVTSRTILQFVRQAVRVAKEQGVPKIVFNWQDLVRGFDVSGFAKQAHVEKKEDALCTFAETLASHAAAAHYDFVKYKSNKVIGGVAECAFVHVPKEVESAFVRGAAMGNVVNSVRDTANTPANHMTPEILAKSAVEMFKGMKHVKVTVFDTKKMESLKMGLVLGVAQGSQHPPRFIVVEYFGAPTSGKKKGAGQGKAAQVDVVLVGKGVTFDSGGIQIKPGSGASIHEMHMDMSGGIVCLGALKVIAEQKFAKNVVVIVPAVENMVSKESYRPGDILTAMNGKTVEILNTDAEGRLILADALTYAQKMYAPKLVVDVATLTGASVVATGTVASPFMTNRPEFVRIMMGYSELAGEYHWPLPLWSEYDYVLKSDRADMANIATAEPRSAGSIAGAKFLEQFVHKDTPWVHIDMAPRMDSNGRDGLGKGSTGEPVRTLVNIVKGI
jgi:leucyl aminopeptidase